MKLSINRRIVKKFHKVRIVRIISINPQTTILINHLLKRNTHLNKAYNINPFSMFHPPKFLSIRTHLEAMKDILAQQPSSIDKKMWSNSKNQIKGEAEAAWENMIRLLMKLSSSRNNMPK